MNTTEQQKLISILKRLNAGEQTESVKEEAKEFIASVSPEDLSFAEQQLVDEGLDPSELRHLCSAHLEVLGEELQQLKEQLPPGHVVHTLVSEHEKILEFLDELEEINQKVQQMRTYEPDREEFGRLPYVAEHLVESEPHHEREEDILFPELEDRGITGPPYIIRMEHEQLRERKKTLKELATNVGEMDFSRFKEQLDENAKFVVATLRDHIFKENNILYPTALEVIEYEELWEKMKTECDHIGYCCFTREQQEAEL